MRELTMAETSNVSGAQFDFYDAALAVADHLASAVICAVAGGAGGGTIGYMHGGDAMGVLGLQVIGQLVGAVGGGIIGGVGGLIAGSLVSLSYSMPLIGQFVDLMVSGGIK